MGKQAKNILIELMSVCKLKECLLKTRRIIPVINDTDKEPIWDGSLYLYDTEENIVNDLCLGNIPIQVKGTCRYNYSDNQISYPVSVVNLKHYKKDGGAVYFVVVMGKSFDKFSIFYKTLLPFDILRELQGKNNQKEISIHMDRFPDDDAEKMIAIFRSFVINKEKQSGTAAQGLKVREALFHGTSKDELNIKDFTFTASKNIFDDIDKLPPIYIYARDENDIEIPIDVVELDTIFTEQVCQIIIGKDTYSCNVGFENSADGESLIIEHSITIFMPRQLNTAEEATLSIKINLSDILDERIMALKMVISMYRYKDLSIPNVLSGSCGNFDTINIETMEEQLHYMIKIKKALDMLQVNKKLCMKDITRDDTFWISTLVRGLVDKESLDDRVKFNSSIGTIGFCNLKILAYMDKSKTGKRYIRRPKPEELKGMIEFEGESKTMYPITVCSILKKDDFISIDNLSHDIIYDSMTLCGYHPETSANINSMALKIIAAYDICHKEELINIAIDIFKWLIQNDKQNIYIINLYQCIKRKQSLSVDDRNELISLKSDTNDRTILWSINLLLDNKEETEYYWNKLSVEEQENIKQFPIYKLYS